MAASEITQIRVATPKPFGPPGRFSAIDKQPVQGRIWLGALGLRGDQPADTKNHGGLEKALHQYCADHYNTWRNDLPEIAGNFTPGAFGENVVAGGMNEAAVCVGDIYTIGDAVVQVTQGRQPCWKLNIRFGHKELARRVQNTGMTGWYYRVLTEGWISPGDNIALRSRPNADWSLERVHQTIYFDTLNTSTLAEISELEGLSAAWRSLVQRRLQSRAVESWDSRLGGSAGGKR